MGWGKSKGYVGKGAWEVGKGSEWTGKGSGKSWVEPGEWSGKGSGKSWAEAGEWQWQPYVAVAWQEDYGSGGSVGSSEPPTAPPAATEQPAAEAALPATDAGGLEPLWHQAVGGKGSASRRADQRMAEASVLFYGALTSRFA